MFVTFAISVFLHSSINVIYKIVNIAHSIRSDSIESGAHQLDNTTVISYKSLISRQLFGRLFNSDRVLPLMDYSFTRRRVAVSTYFYQYYSSSRTTTVSVPNIDYIFRVFDLL